MKQLVNNYLTRTTHAAPLAVFRIGFGFMMVYSIVRFWAMGWIKTVYLDPTFHFTYYGFEWVRPLGNYTYLLFFLCVIAALFIALGYKYRIATIVFFSCFTYIELMEKTTYLNHYYFISVVSFLMIFLPAQRYFSLDYYASAKANATIPRYTTDSLKFLLAIVYFYAGLAKINSDWLLRAMPLKIWLPAKYDLPVLGTFLQQEWVHYAMSWSGMLYDLCIPFLLIYKRTRWFAFGLVVVFHVLTRILFPIGVFPFVMIVSALIFMDNGFHNRVIRGIRFMLKPISKLWQPTTTAQITPIKKPSNLAVYCIAGILLLQVIVPFRYLAYPGELFWTEEGYRFSWRVMLMEKMGNTQFKIVNKETGSAFYVNNSDFLNPYQEKQMSFQPDFILQYAHYLGDHFTSQGHKNVAVYATCYVALNGRNSQQFIDPTVNLYLIKESFQHKSWVLPFKDDIKGL